MKKRMMMAAIGLIIGIMIVAFGKRIYQIRYDYPVNNQYPAQWHILSMTSWFMPEIKPNEFITVKTGIIIGYEDDRQCWLGTSDGMADCQRDILIFLVVGDGKTSYQINLFYLVIHDKENKENGFLKGC
jgi:hypothetical protein